MLGVIASVTGYLFYGSTGAVVGAALGPLSTVILAIAFRPASVTDFLTHVADERASKMEQ